MWDTKNVCVEHHSKTTHTKNAWNLLKYFLCEIVWSEWYTYTIHVSRFNNPLSCLLFIYTDWSGFNRWHQQGIIAFTWIHLVSLSWKEQVFLMFCILSVYQGSAVKGLNSHVSELIDLVKKVIMNGRPGCGKRLAYYPTNKALWQIPSLWDT